MEAPIDVRATSRAGLVIKERTMRRNSFGFSVLFVASIDPSALSVQQPDRRVAEILPLHKS
jgi:hypothetical protein